MTERDYFNLKLEALSWLMGFRQDHPDFTFRFAQNKLKLFQGNACILEIKYYLCKRKLIEAGIPAMVTATVRHSFQKMKLFTDSRL